jgi:hypothetical protein
MSDDVAGEGREESGAIASWWPELVGLVEHLEAEAARREGRSPRPAAEVCAAIERRWFWPHLRRRRRG